MKEKHKRKYITASAVLITTLFLTSGFAASIALTNTGKSNGSLVTASDIKSAIFYSMTNDGQLDRYQYIGIGGGSYSDARNAQSAQDKYTGSNEICFGQDFVAGVAGHACDVFVKRGFLYFNTASELPDNAYIVHSELTLFGRYKEFDKGGEHFDIYIQDGGSYPHDNLQKGDFYYQHYQSSPNGVESFNSRNFQCDKNSPKENVLTLNNDGISWIEISGNKLTKFCLRSSRDVEAKWKDDGSEYLSIWAAEKDKEYRPKLKVFYTRKPVASISDPDPDKPTKNEKVEFEGSGADDDGDDITEYKWKVDGVVQQQTGSTLKTSFSTGGSHSVSLRVKDEHGAWSDWVSDEVDVSSNVEPTHAHIDGTSTPEKHEEETYTFSAKDRNKEKLTFTINWGTGDDITREVSPNNKGECSIELGHTYNVQTDYIIHLTVEDGYGKTDSDQLPISVNKIKNQDYEGFDIFNILAKFPKINQLITDIGLFY